MTPSSCLELRLDIPRWQKRLAWGAGALFFGVAILVAREDWARGVRGWSLWAPAAARMLQGLLFQQVCLGLDAKVLLVEEGRLTVTSRIRRGNLNLCAARQ